MEKIVRSIPETLPSSLEIKWWPPKGLSAMNEGGGLTVNQTGISVYKKHERRNLNFEN